MCNRVLITGITGFLGANIAEALIKSNIQVIGLKRKESDTWRCKSFIDKILWVDIDEYGQYKKTLKTSKFDVFIHCAWIGVKAADRNDEQLQNKNIQFLNELTEIARNSGTKKIIFLGSQAEYGLINGILDEGKECYPTDAYSKAKLNCLNILKKNADENNINWIWLRIFSIFGEKEDKSWLIPSLIEKMKTENHMDLTRAEQKYAYMYVKDFANIIHRISINPIKSGIYNVSSKHAVSIRTLVEKLRDKVNPSFKLNFGVLDYRPNQSMHIEGSIDKLTEQIGEINFTDFDLALNQTIKYYNN